MFLPGKSLKHCAAFAMVAATGFLAGPLPGAAQVGEAPGFRPGRTEQEMPTAPKPLKKMDLRLPEAGRVLGEKLREITLQLREVKVEGATIFNEAELGALYQDMIGREVSLADVYLIEESITQKYRDAGYILSRALIPEQRIREGVVRVVVVEGFIDSIQVEGPEKIRGRVLTYASKILDSRPVTIRDMERYLLLVNDLPGIKASGIVRPSPKTPGASELVITTEHDEVSGSLSYDNYGSLYLGPDRVSLAASLDSWAGLGERLALSYIQTIDMSELKYMQASFSLPIMNEGLVLQLRHAFGPSRPGEQLSVLEAESKSRFSSVGLSYPFLRARDMNLSLEGGYSSNKASTHLLGQLYTEDQIHEVYARGVFDFADAWGGTNLCSLTVVQGLDGTTEKESVYSTRPEAGPAFRVYRGELQRLQSLGFWHEGLSLVLGAQWQYADEPVYASEEIGVGGRTIGRGYDLGELLGDRGVAGQVELRYEQPLPWNLMCRYYGFFDAGKVWNLDVVDANTPNETPSLESAGVGLYLYWKETVSLHAEVAKPLTRVPDRTDDRDPWFSMGVSFSF